MSWVILSLLLSTVPPIVKPSRGRFGAFLDRAKASAPSVDPDRAKASVLLQRRSLADCEAAVELLERALRRTPDDASLCLECATALNAVMRQRTHSNTLHITRMLDTAESKRVWAQHGIAAQPEPDFSSIPRPPRILTRSAESYPNQVRARSRSRKRRRRDGRLTLRRYSHAAMSKGKARLAG